MVKGGGLPLAFDATKSSNIGLLRRDAPGSAGPLGPSTPPAPVQWFKLPAFFNFHGERTTGRAGLAARRCARGGAH